MILPEIALGLRASTPLPSEIACPQTTPQRSLSWAGKGCIPVERSARSRTYIACMNCHGASSDENQN